MRNLPYDEISELSINYITSLRSQSSRDVSWSEVVKMPHRTIVDVTCKGWGCDKDGTQLQYCNDNTLWLEKHTEDDKLYY